MKIAAFLLIFFILLLATSVSVSATDKSINFRYPQGVNYGEEFDVSVELTNFPQNIYDVKIDVLNSSAGRIARIFNNGEWKSTYYYVNDAINTSEKNSGSFKINVTQECEGIATINITIKTSSKTFKFGGYNIDVKIPFGDETDNPPESEATQTDENSNASQQEQPAQQPEQAIVTTQPKAINNKKESLLNNEKQENIEEQKEPETKQERQEKQEQQTEANNAEISAITGKAITIYESKNELMKRNAVHLFLLLTIGLLVYMIFRKQE